MKTKLLRKFRKKYKIEKDYIHDCFTDHYTIGRFSNLFETFKEAHAAQIWNIEYEIQQYKKRWRVFR